ncbi:MAG: hypothetical protein E7379_02130 [Clostridiales bacterium]|nr:hypothetical protein [Clostridiales bacterium]
MDNRRLKQKVHYSFLILFVWFILTQNLYSFILFCATVLTHEYGHYVVAKKLGYRLKNFCIAPYGVCLNYQEKVFEQRDELLIALAGPIVNIVLSIICISFWWIAPSFYNYSYDFVFQSLVLGLFNLLPCYPLDGGRIFVGVMSRYLPRKKAINIATCLNIMIAIVLFIAFIVSCFINFNLSLCVCAVFMILSCVDGKTECKYQLINMFDKKNKSYSKPLFLFINNEETLSNLVRHLELNKVVVFVAIVGGKTKLLDEQAVLSLSLIYPLSASLNDIFKQDKE